MADEPTYVDLNELLTAWAEHRDLVALVGLTDLSDLALEVKLKTINSLLMARAPDVLDPADTERFDLFLEALAGATAEVEAIVGADPQPATRRKLALRAIAYATAADLEESLFPEQQQGDDARAAYLRRRYDELLGLLRAESTDTGIVTGPLSPVGTFPAALPYPDPARRADYAGRGYYPC